MSRFQPIQSKYYSGFNPLNIGDCALWLDAADSTTVTLSGSNVTQWNDKSGNGYNATQGTAGQRPTYSNRGVYFNAAASNNMAISVPYPNNFTMFLVASSTSVSGAYYLGRANSGGGGPTLIANFTGSSIEYFNVADRATFSTSPTSTFLISFTQQLGGRIVGFYNGASAFDIAQTNNVNPGVAWSTLGNSYLTTYNNYITGFMYEMIIFNSILSTAQRQQVEGYLAWKWLGSGPVSSITAFIPTQISNCAMWLDAADSSTVTLSGSNVTTWADKSGSSNNATQSTTSNGPVYSSNGLVFNGSNWLTTPITSAPTAESLFLVMRYTTNTTADIFTGTSAGLREFLIYNGSMFVGRFGTAPSGTNGGAIASGTTNLLTYQYTTTQVTFTVNGRVTGSGAPPYTYTGSGTTFIGSSTFAPNNLYGTIYEIVYYSRSLTTTERQQVENYLTSKWGISRVGLPSTHPYSSILPVTRAFQPIDISGCALWLDAADPSTVTLSGSNVTRWNDKSGNGRNASSVGTITYSNTINNCNAMVFSGANNTYLTGAVANTGTTLTAIAVFLMNAASSASARVLSLGVPGTFDYNSALYAGPIQRRVGSSLGSFRNMVDVALAAVIGVPTLFASVYTGSSNIIFLNGGTSNSGASTGSFGYTNYEIGTAFGEEASNPFSGSVGEVIVYNAALTTFQRQQLEGYLARKWGLLAPSTDLITFTPTQISDCALWLDAADRSTITLSGSNVTQWSDKSGTSNHAVTSLRFSWLGPTVTSSNTLRFTRVAGTSVQMLRTQTGRQTTRPVTFAVVVKPIETNAGAMMDFQKTTNGQAFHALFPSQMNVRGSSGATITSYSFTQLPTSSFSVVCFQSTSNVFNGYINGTAFATATATLSMPITDAVYTTIGALTDLNYDGGGFATASNQIANTASSEFAEVLMFNALLNTTQRQQVEGYLAIKWGIRSSLPSTHPYAITSLPASHPMRTMLPATVSFNPRQIPNCALWLDAADLPTLTLSGSNVTTWLDKSGNGRNTSTFCNAPTFSNRAVRFSTNQGLAVNLSASSATESGFIVCGFTDYSVPSTLLGSSNGDGGRQFRVSGGVIQTVKQDIAGVVLSGTGLSLNTTQLTEYVNNGTTLTHYWNGATYASGSTISYTGGRTTSIGYRWGPFEPFNGYIQEILVYDRAVSTEERRQIEGYLAWKWGLQGSLSLLTTFSVPGISGCTLWLDAADSSTFTFSSGSNISQWRDKSSSALTGTAVNSPTLIQSGINGFPSVSFNGSSQYINFGNVLNMGTNHIYVFVVCQFSSTAGGGVVGKTSARANPARWALLRESGNMIMLIEGASVAINNCTYADSSTRARVLTGYWDRSNVFNLENGIQRAVVALADTSSLSNTDPLYVGAYPNSTGTGPQAGLYFGGTIAEIIVYQAALTTTQRQQVETYLASKWGVSGLGLPSTHPYKKISPI